jgi:hypothetical protein
MEEDDSQLGRLLPIDFGDIRRGLPIHRSPTHDLPLENEMKESSRIAVLIVRVGALADGNLNGHRKFLEGRALLIVC